MESLFSNWFSNSILTWGLGPYLAANIGFYIPTFFLEWLIRQSFMKSSLITYSSKSDKTREQFVISTQKKVSFWEQFKCSALTISGPSAILSGVINVAIMHYFYKNEEIVVFPTWQVALLQLTLLFIIGDFFLYWGHRIQHSNEWLWKNCHSVHHQLDTPTPVSTVYIESIDATLQAKLPMLFAALIVKPAPLILYVYVALRIAENVLNHSGVENTLLNIITLKSLPLRASVAHHDTHHKYSNYTGSAKNYGEGFWVWDWMFGTLGKYPMN